MNYETVNYAYLAGFLESQLRSLATDYRFSKMDCTEERAQYIKNLIDEANKNAKDFEKKMKAA